QILKGCGHRATLHRRTRNGLLRPQHGQRRAGARLPRLLADRCNPGRQRRLGRWTQGRRGYDSIGGDPHPPRKPCRMNPCSTVLLTDLYQLAMVQAYVEQGMLDTAVFEFFVRRLPAQRGFLMAAGSEQVLDFLEQLQVSPAELEWLKQTGRF